MKPIEFDQTNVKVAEKQDQYLTLPAHHNEEEGILTSCWELTPEEAEIVRNTGKIYMQQWTFNAPMQPILPSIENPLEL